jgi:hypothetical protein
MKKIFASLCLLPPAVLAAQTNDLSALTPAYPEIPPTFLEQHKMAVAICFVLFVIAQFWTLYKVLTRPPAKVEPPESRARAALRGLLNEPEDGKLLSEVSRILRGYFGKQFQTAGEEATTAEFVAALERKSLDAGLKTKVATFLRECDARKFSPAAGKSEIDAAERALDLVNDAEKIRAGQNANA